MAAYIVVYDLHHKLPKAYEEIDEYLESIGAHHTHSSTWLFCSDESKEEIWRRIQAKIGERARLSIFELKEEAMWQHPKEGTQEWLEDHFENIAPQPRRRRLTRLVENFDEF